MAVPPTPSAVAAPLDRADPYDPADPALTEHFRLSEFITSATATRAGLGNTPQPWQRANLQRLAQWLEVLRLNLGCPIVVLSGYRSPAVNKRVGGAPTSAHLRGLAVDFTAPGFGTPRQVCQRIVALGLPFDQLIYEGTWVHLGLADPGAALRQQVLTATFAKGLPTQYRVGLA